MKRAKPTSTKPTPKPVVPGPAPLAPSFKPTVHFPTVMIPLGEHRFEVRPGKPVLISNSDEIGTTEAGRILGVTGDTVARMCDGGTFKELTEWRRLGSRGVYRIRRAAVLARAGLMEAQP